MKAPQHEVLAAFIETKIHDKEKLKQIYITIAKNVSNAIFVKQKAEQSYSEFIKTYNVSANKLRDAIQAINSLYRNDCEPYKNEIFCNRFRKFIHTYNTKLQNSEISFYNLNDIENEFMKPLKAVLAHADMAKSISHQLIHEHENLSISLDKINELKDFLINNFEHYINAMRDISEVIESNSKLIK
ncbi:MAG: hypothetical protein IPI90_07745 [Saprospiraceae bacterium]|nr:hypothetical protein [Candidatus Vicinibacter affinis]